MAAAAVLDAQVGRYVDLPTRPDRLHRAWVDVDVAGWLCRGRGGRVVLARGKHAGRTLTDVAWSDGSYLHWLAGRDLLGDLRLRILRARSGRPRAAERRRALQRPC